MLYLNTKYPDGHDDTTKAMGTHRVRWVTQTRCQNMGSRTRGQTGAGMAGYGQGTQFIPGGNPCKTLDERYPREKKRHEGVPRCT